MSDSSFSKGIGLAIAASVFWGSMGVCAQYLLQQCSFTPLDLVSMRLVLAGLILLIMERLVFGRNIISPLKDIRTTVGILVAGLLILVSQLTFMLAVAASNAGTAAIVLTLVPLICAFWLSITEKRPLTMREGICFVLAASRGFLDRDQRKLQYAGLVFCGRALGFCIGNIFCRLLHSAEKTHYESRRWPRCRLRNALRRSCCLCDESALDDERSMDCYVCFGFHLCCSCWNGCRFLVLLVQS